jgi:predicted DNA binding CopG/RHH family protein
MIKGTNINIRIGVKEKEQIEKAALEQGITFSEFIRFALRLVLMQRQGQLTLNNVGNDEAG